MKTLSILNCSFGILTALGVFMVLSSWAVAGAPAQGALKESSLPPIVSTYDLNGLAITTTVLAPDYTKAKVEFVLGSEHRISTRLFAGTNELSYSNRAKDSYFSLNLIFLPPSGPCQLGGLYLDSVKVKPSKETPIVDLTNRTIAAWTSSGQLIDPWLTPFDAPILREQKGVRQSEDNGPLSHLGRWKYEVTYGSRAIPQNNCPIVTNVELKLISADELLPSRTYHYTITEQYKRRRVFAQISAVEPDAPGAVVAIDESKEPDLTRRLTFSGLDALRDAKAHVALSFEQPSLIKPIAVSFPSYIRPMIQIDTELDVTEGKPSAPLAAHLARVFSELTGPLLGISSAMTTSVPIKINISLSTTSTNSTQTMMPLATTKTFLTLGKGISSDCTSTSTQGLNCTLAAAMEKAASKSGTPAPAASYVMEITFFNGATGDVQPVLRLNRVVVPLKKVAR